MAKKQKSSNVNVNLEVRTTPLATLTNNLPKLNYRNVREYLRPLTRQHYRRIVFTRYKETIGFHPQSHFNDVRRHALWEALSHAIDTAEINGANDTPVLQMQSISCKLEDDISEPYKDKQFNTLGKAIDDPQLRNTMFLALELLASETAEQVPEATPDVHS